MAKKILYFGIITVLVGFLTWGLAFGGDMEASNTSNKPVSTYTYPIMAGYTSTANGTAGVGEKYNIGFTADTHTWQITFVGTPTNVNVKLEGSIDEANWFTLDTYSTTSPEDYIRWVRNKDADFVRGHLVTFTGNSSISLESKHGSD